MWFLQATWQHRGPIASHMCVNAKFKVMWAIQTAAINMWRWCTMNSWDFPPPLLSSTAKWNKPILFLPLCPVAFDRYIMQNQWWTGLYQLLLAITAENGTFTLTGRPLLTSGYRQTREGFCACVLPKNHHWLLLQTECWTGWNSGLQQFWTNSSYCLDLERWKALLLLRSEGQGHTPATERTP